METLRFDILTEMPMNITPLWNVTRFVLGYAHRHFERTCCIHSTMNIETARAFIKEANIYEVTRCCIAEGDKLYDTELYIMAGN
jgi:hypothetical protein